MRVGSELEAARKKAGITLEVISKRTNIKVNKLVALEKHDFKNLPTGLYLFCTVRAYAREVHIDPEPLVERLRAEFADKDVLDAQNLANAGKSREAHSNLFRNAAVTAGVVFMAAAGAGAALYLHNMGRSTQEVPSTKAERSSGAPIVNSPNEIPSVPLSSPAPAATVAIAVDVPQRVARVAPRPAPPKTRRPGPRTAAVKRGLQETVATAGELSEVLGSPANIEEVKPEAPAPAP